jgi:hypothetical protein
VFKVGFTGTQIGCTPEQKATLRLRFALMREQSGQCEFHHGDCIGADQYAHGEAVAAFFATVGHPPLAASKRAFTRNDSEREAKEYLERNRDIVNETYGLIACPKFGMEELRSGTWATVRYARKLKRPIMIIHSDGSCRFENVTDAP